MAGEFKLIPNVAKCTDVNFEEVKHKSMLASRRLLGIPAGWLGVMHRGPCMMFGPTSFSTMTNFKTQTCENHTPPHLSHDLFMQIYLSWQHDDSYHLEVINGKNWFR